ncbi:MAG: hypothetical protein AAF555_00670 [Verrucomicrobiota bacterium]
MNRGCLTATALISSATLVGLLFYYFRVYPSARISIASAYCMSLEDALAEHNQEHGPLSSTENQRIFEVLLGDNPMQTNYLEERLRFQLDEKGRAIDPWSSPFEIQPDFRVISPGPDKVLRTEDDVTSAEARKSLPQEPS